MDCDASRHSGKLFLEADEANHRSVCFEPRGSATWGPTILAGGLIGNGDGSGEQVLDYATHGGVIALNADKEQGADRSRTLLVVQLLTVRLSVPASNLSSRHHRKSKSRQRVSIANMSLRRSPTSDRDTSAYGAHDRAHDYDCDRTHDYDYDYDRAHDYDCDRAHDAPQRTSLLETTGQPLLRK